MVTLEPPEKVLEVSQESEPAEQEAPQWFSCAPSAGVTYYSFEARPPRNQTVKPSASEDTSPGIP